MHSKNRDEGLFPGGFRCLGLAAPAGPIAGEKYAAACRFLTGQGIRFIAGNSILKGDEAFSYLSAPTEDRAADFNTLIRNPEIQALYCLRGGYGSVHLLNKLDWNTLKRRKLPVIGYSDITVLHAAMQSMQSGIAVSAGMALQLESDARQSAFRRNFRRALGIAEGRNGSFRKIAALQPCGSRTTLDEVPVFCGNLTLLASLCGTGYLPDTGGRAVFLEDIAEPVRKIDRSLTQLMLSGFFEGCAGVVFGNFKQCGSPEERRNLFRKFASELAVPVFSGLHYGHCSRSISLVCGETAFIRRNSLFLRDPFSGKRS